MLLLLLSCRGDDPAPTTTGTDPLTLDAGVEVIVDSSGVSHIYAETEDDAHFMQGYVTASDRLFQMDILRRRAYGTRAEILGESYYSSDLQSRALRFAEYGAATAAALPDEDPEIWATMQAYAAGVDAYISDAVAGRNGASLPPQFAALGYEPDPWTATDSLTMEKLLTAGLAMRPDQDLILGLIRMLLGADMFSDLYRFRGFDDAYVVPGFYDDVPARPQAPAPGRQAQLPGATPQQLIQSIHALKSLRMDEGGSNNMAIDAAHSADGVALLASDSHQGVEHPAAYYLVHLSTAESGGTLDVVGATFPGVPMVMFGHNAEVAWGPTTNIFDVSDAWLETMDGDDAVVLDGGSVDIEIDDVTINVRLEDGSIEAREETVRWVPHHGPMMPTDTLPLPLNVSVGWTGYQARSAARAFLELNRMGSYADFESALSHYYTGGMHWLYADTSGSIGYSSYTEVPVREVIDPDSPPVILLDGTGGYEWTDEVLPQSEVPFIESPVEGWLASANNDPVGTTDDNDPFNDPRYLSGIFDIGTRAWQPGRLIEQHIAAGDMSYEVLQNMQLDTLSRPGERMTPYILLAAERRSDLVDEELAEAIAILEEWDYRCGLDSVGATLFHAWMAIFTREVLQDEGGGLLADLLFEEMDARLGLVTTKFIMHFLDATADNIDAIEAGEADFPSATGTNYFDNSDTEELETRDAVILSSLSMALSELADVTGSGDISTYTWGSYHTVELTDAADAVLPEASSERLPKTGALYTVDVADYPLLIDGHLPEQLDVDNAPSNRFVYALHPGAIRAEMILPGGQSERPDSPYHLDMLQEYLDGDYRRMNYYRDEVTAERAGGFTAPAGFPAEALLTDP